MPPLKRPDGEPQGDTRCSHVEATNSCTTNPETSNNVALGHSPSPTFPRKFADVDWGSQIIPNEICVECWPVTFGPCWLLTERLRYETTPLLPALRCRVHVHGRRDVAYASHCRSHAASGYSRAAGASRRREQHRRQG